MSPVSAIRGDRGRPWAYWCQQQLQSLRVCPVCADDIAGEYDATKLVNTMLVAIHLARAGDAARAESLANETAKTYPSDTAIREYYLPIIRAEISMDRNDPGKALEILQAASAYELVRYLVIPYERGQAYLLEHKGNEAAAEFQKLLDHRGAVGISIDGVLAHLQLGRAYAIAGDDGKARTA